jgi:hypothetical protein
MTTEEPSTPTPTVPDNPDPGQSPDPSPSKTYTEEQYQRAVNRKLANYVPKQEYQTALERASSLEKALGESQTAIQDMKTKLSGFELASIKAKIGKEVGLPEAWIEDIRGQDEKSIREDADRLRKKLGIKQNAGNPVPTFTPGQPENEHDEMNAALRMLAGVGTPTTR